MYGGYAGCPFPNLAELCPPACGPCCPPGYGGMQQVPQNGVFGPIPNAPLAPVQGGVGQYWGGGFPQNGGAMDPRCFLCPPWARNTLCRDEVVNINSLQQSPTVVDAGATATYTATASSPFQPFCMIVPSHIAQFFIILDIIIGNERVFNNAQGASATIFSEVSTCRVCQWPVLYPGLQWSVTVQNVDDEAPVQAHLFNASLLGKTIEC